MYYSKFFVTHLRLGASQVVLVVKNLFANAGDIREVGSVPGSGRSSGGRHGNPLQYSCLENPHGQRSLAGYNPWGPKDSDMTETIQHTHTHTHTHNLTTYLWYTQFLASPNDYFTASLFPNFL